VRVLWVDSLIRLRSRSFGLSMYYFSTIWREGVHQVSILPMYLVFQFIESQSDSTPGLDHGENHISVQFCI
jgi:hypothetical protein